MAGLGGRGDAVVFVERHQEPQLAKGHIHRFQSILNIGIIDFTQWFNPLSIAANFD
jgi:hypothetical protein